MEASLIDMTRGLEPFVPRFQPEVEVEIEIVRNDDDGEYDVIIEYTFESASLDAWFSTPEDALALDDELPVTPIATRRSLHTVLGFAAAVALASGLYASTL